MMTFALRALLVLSLSFHPTDARAQSFESDVAAFDAELQDLRREHRIVGLAAALVKDRTLAWSNAYGQAFDEVPVTTDTPFWIASVTKPSMGVLFLQVEAEGVIDLQDRVNQVPDWD